MKEIKTKDAVGHVISHDITQIIPGKIKDVLFKKGHVVREEDIEALMKVGKMNLYVFENDGTVIHENEAASMLADIVAPDDMARSAVKEGKIEISAPVSGVLRVNKEKLNALNSFDDIMVATRHDYTPVKKGDKLAGTRIIPLVIKNDVMAEAQALRGDAPILELKPYVHKKAAIVTTGSEVFEGLIEDGFTPVVQKKLLSYDAEEIGHVTVPDDPKQATDAIKMLIERGADIVFVTGGMSVDPDDKTPLAIKNTGAEIISYGAPVLPGAMFMVSYLNGIPVLGLPGCVMHAPTTILDLVLPRIMADIPVTKQDIINLGAGGFCLQCEKCNYPVCGFGAQ